jgi:hypothetical protein
MVAVDPRLFVRTIVPALMVPRVVTSNWLALVICTLPYSWNVLVSIVL